MPSIFITENLTKRAIQVAKNQRCERIAYATGNPSLLDAVSELEYVPVAHLDFEAYWLGWELAEDLVGTLSNQFPELFFVDGIDLRRAAVKGLWWSLFNTKGRLVRYADYFLEQGERVVIHTSLQIPSRLQDSVTVVPSVRRLPGLDNAKVLASGVGYCFGKNIFNRQSVSLPASGIPHIGGLVFFARAVKQVEFFERLLKQFATDEVQACLGVEPLADPDVVIAIEKRGIPYVAMPPEISLEWAKQIARLMAQILRYDGKIKRIAGRKEGYYLQQKLLGFLRRSYQYRSVCRQLKPDIFLTNAFEVAPVADLLVQVAHDYGAKVVNTMNGLKLVSPINKDTRFDAWCVWSNTQKQMLVEGLETPANQLLVTGHLQADVAANYEYQGTLDHIVKQWPGKKIMAVFSNQQFFSGPYRQKFLDTISHYVEKRPHIIGILKPHPHENTDDLETFIQRSERIILLRHDRKQPTTQLYDLLKIANLTVVMFSTVAIESLFFQTPVISLNYTNIHKLLPLEADNKWLYKVTTESAFRTCADALIYNDGPRPRNHDLSKMTGELDGKSAKRTALVIRSLLRP